MGNDIANNIRRMNSAMLQGRSQAGNVCPRFSVQHPVAVGADDCQILKTSFDFATGKSSGALASFNSLRPAIARLPWMGAAAENYWVDDLFAAAFEERLLEFERLKEKASHGSYQKFLRVMSKIPAVEPPEHDRF
jgi:hypothetical protein